MVDAIGIDIGGTNVRVAGVSAAGEVVGEVRRASTPFGDVDALVAVVADLTGDAQVPVGVGVAGGISRGRLVGAPNLGIDGAEVGPLLAERLGRGVTIVNDADAATWAEHRRGAASGIDDVVMLTLGTGIGGGAVIAGRLLRGATGLAAEFGHLVVDEGGPRCACGNNGCFEAHASGSAMALGDRTAGEVAAAARAGDEVAAAHLTRIGTWVGVGLATLVAAFDPAMLVLGGGAGAATFDVVAPPARASLDARLFGRAAREAPPLVAARLGDDAGVIGAALLAMEESA